MLLPIREETPPCAIFQGLNSEVLHFLKSSIEASRFTKYLLSSRLRTALWNNEPTKEQFRALWNQLQPISRQQRNDIYDEYSQNQFIQQYYEDTNHPLPTIPDSINTALGGLCKHLFAKTSGLAGVRTSCAETLHESFGKYRTANKNICCFCGSSELAQVRAGVDENKQWRAANDHLLSKDEYPSFAVHPDNLTPLCETCNSKAKLAKDLLNRKQSGQPDVRRRCFFPFTESCHEYVGVTLDRGELGLRALFTMNPDSPEIAEKLDTWNEVYQIQSRVDGKFIELASLVDSDCPAENLANFRRRVREKAATCLLHVRTDGWNFWKGRLYEWLDQDDGSVLEELWSSIQDSRADADAEAVFGI
jgi:hypothetical protein